MFGQNSCMKIYPLRSAVILLTIQVAMAPAAAEVALREAHEAREANTRAAATLPGATRCEPYARELSGIAINGEARTWWKQAEGRYVRTSRPRVGAVLNFAPQERLHLGHLATVTRIVDNRTILVSHANWAPASTRAGRIERGVPVVDVSPGNTWSDVRVGLTRGQEPWPVLGFILPVRVSAAVKQPAAGPSHIIKSSRPSAIGPDFLQGIGSAARSVSRAPGQGSSSDPIGRIIAARM